MLGSYLRNFGKNTYGVKIIDKVEFKSWGKIPRENPFKATITEKMDGTNAAVIIRYGEVVGVQSRKRLITPEDDNYGFARWVSEQPDIVDLGDGYHYGEWAGRGIQKNPHNLDKKEFFLFNTFRWSEANPSPACCKVVPVLFQGVLEASTITDILGELVRAADEAVTPEGIIVYYHAFRKYTKHTLKTPNGKWRP